MKELLERWAKLEPERCKWHDDSYRESFHVLYKGEIEDVWLEGGEFDEAYIQAAVQEAIEAHEWNWETSKKGIDPSGKWQRFASVWPAFAGRGKDAWAMSLDSNAHALLDAYLQALEAR